MIIRIEETVVSGLHVNHAIAGHGVPFMIHCYALNHFMIINLNFISFSLKLKEALGLYWLPGFSRSILGCLNLPFAK